MASELAIIAVVRGMLEAKGIFTSFAFVGFRITRSRSGKERKSGCITLSRTTGGKKKAFVKSQVSLLSVKIEKLHNRARRPDARVLRLQIIPGAARNGNRSWQLPHANMVRRTAKYYGRGVGAWRMRFERDGKIPQHLLRNTAKAKAMSATSLAAMAGKMPKTPPPPDRPIRRGK